MAGVVHISEEEAARNAKALFEQVKAGQNAIVHSAGKADVMLELTREPSGGRAISIFLAP